MSILKKDQLPVGSRFIQRLKSLVFAVRGSHKMVPVPFKQEDEKELGWAHVGEDFR